MKKFLVLFFFVLTVSVVSAQGNLQDVVYLRNGNIFRGTIIEQVPNVSIRLRTNDGNVFLFQMDEIERMTRERAVGVRQQSEKNPVLAWGLSFLIPGVGQFYNGEIGKGIGFLAGAIVGNALFLAGDPWGWYPNEGLVLAGSAILLTSWVWAQIDAPRSANRINRENAGFASWNLGNDTFLSIQPDFQLSPVYASPNGQRTLASGVGIRLNF